jgi:LPXTG-motif cell wall-anchored protein
VYAHWTGTTNLISWLDARTGWLPLPAPCEVDQVVEVPPPAVDETTTTTSTTVAAGVGGVSSTTVTTDPPAAVKGVSAERPAAVASAQVQAQAISTQTLPDTGSSSGLLAAGAVLMISIGAGLVAASRRSLHTITVSAIGTTEPR